MGEYRGKESFKYHETIWKKDLIGETLRVKGNKKYESGWVGRRLQWCVWAENDD